MELGDDATDSASLVARVAELQAAVAARDRFIAAVGHDLRNAMAPLAMLAEMLEVPTDPTSAERRAAILSRNLNRLVGTLDRVTAVAELRSETLVLALETVELCTVVREVVAESTADAVAAAVELRVDASLAVTGRWDRSRLRQITRHLVTNAIRHSGGGPVDISVSHDDHHAELIVADRGRGIEASRRARLFDAFEIAEVKRNGGLGVGLWIVKTLCRHFKGTVTLLDDDGPGTRFRVVLPRV